MSAVESSIDDFAPGPRIRCAISVDVQFAWLQYGYHVGRFLEGNYQLEHSFIPLCCYFSAFAWVLFDYVLTFNDEVTYVWTRPLRSGSLLFYLLRYLGMISLAAGIAIYLWPQGAYISSDVNICPSQPPSLYIELGLAIDVIFSAVPLLQFSVFLVAEAVLQTRIFALYGSMRLAAVNGLLFCMEITAMICLWCYLPGSCREDGPQKVEALLVGFSLKCRYFALYWIPGIAFELWLAALALYKLRPQVLKHDLLTVMVRDSIKYFFLIAIAMVLHIVSAFEEIGEYVIPFVIAGQTIGGSRLVLHLRRAYFRSHHGTSISQRDVSFAAGRIQAASRSRFADETFYVREDIGDESSTSGEE